MSQAKMQRSHGRIEPASPAEPQMEAALRAPTLLLASVPARLALAGLATLVLWATVLWALT